jgi:phytoene dehydrogenase-like protein
LKSEVFIADQDKRISLPAKGLHDRAEALATYFPQDAAAIRKYYDAEQEIVDATPMFDLKHFKQADIMSMLTPYDALTVQEFLDSLSLKSPELKAILPIMALCHGTPPIEADFPYHCRCSYNLDSHLTSVLHGGDAFMTAFKREFIKYGVDIRTATTIQSLEFSSSSPTCTAAILSDETRLEVDDIFFAINPQSFLPLIPDNYLPARIKRRVRNLKQTCSFFTVCGCLDDGMRMENTLTFFLHDSDINQMLLPNATSYSTGIVTSNDPQNDCTTFTAFRTMFLEDCIAQCGPFDGSCRHEQKYLEFKEATTDSILENITQAFPSLRGHLKVMDSSSPLTSQRFSPPIGSAYGTRQAIGVSRLSGRLHVTNCHALGHHAHFPGILGCMLGAYLACM